MYFLPVVDTPMLLG